MSMESSQGHIHDARTPRERLFRKPKPDIRPNNFGKIIRAIYPTKPAACLAQDLGCTERAALYLISGQVKPTAKALAVIVNKCLD